MTNEEFIREFDIYYNNISSNQAPGLDPYEMSVFLTRAQEELIISSYNGANPNKDSFEKTEEFRRYLDKLVKSTTITKQESGLSGISENSSFFMLPEDLLFITYESVKLDGEKSGCKMGDTLVTPVSQDDFFKVSKNPFRGPSKSRVLRLDNGSNIAELISEHDIKSYFVRYIARPKPIILIDLSNTELSINKEKEAMGCELNPILHRFILEKAVMLAIRSMYLGINNQGEN